MKTIFHSDYWVEIPAGEYLVGLSHEHRQSIASRILHQVGYARLTPAEQGLIDSAIEKIRRRVEKITAFDRQFLKEGYAPGYPLAAMGLSEQEFSLMTSTPLKPLFHVESTLDHISLPIAVFVDTFYMAKFPLTEYQEYELLHGASAGSLPGALDEPGEQREIARIQDFSVCEMLGCRAPTRIEWEKAARGLDGRLYPWGNEWNLNAGYFYQGQPPIEAMAGGSRVDEFPQGVSPYGIWGMAGGIPEAVVARRNKIGVNDFFYTSKGCHAKESSEEMAWFDHITALPGKGDWVSLRPVLDKWPQQQWTGFDKPGNQA